MDRYELINQNIQTVLLGCNAASKRIAREIYKGYGIRSYVCDTGGALGCVFSVSRAFWKIPDAACDDIVCEELRHLASFDPSCIYVAVACSREYEALLDRSGERICDVYVISSPDDVFGKLPIFDG